MAEGKGKKRGRGRPPDLARRRRIAELRDRGLTFQQIGARLGISYQAVQKTFKTLKHGTPDTLRCHRCGMEITAESRLARQGGPVLCPGCLAVQPGATFAQRLRALRLAAGLTQAELGRTAGLGKLVVASYEQNRCTPNDRNLAKLVRVLGPGLVAVQRQAQPFSERRSHGPEEGASRHAREAPGRGVGGTL
ncbi:MAG TPA: helix-turn-helix domain-containing protein [Gemmataceae bacterium]|jgi:transcriptional regulator with XRE-family HTH domain|nr:helix-turn-helix domain-containing protein [Gemmataceae bacterium]